jgi:DTW domain-containing protein YfiP
MHHREEHLTSNTATLATKILPQSKFFVRGIQETPFKFSDLNCSEDELPLYLYPHEDALTLSSLNFSFTNKKIHLIVPDGSWTQARKVYRREPGMENIQCVKLPEGFTGEYLLRKTHIPEGLSTFEAIAHSLGIIESDLIEKRMMEVFRVMVSRVIKSRTTFHN